MWRGRSNENSQRKKQPMKWCSVFLSGTLGWELRKLLELRVPGRKYLGIVELCCLALGCQKVFIPLGPRKCHHLQNVSPARAGSHTVGGWLLLCLHEIFWEVNMSKGCLKGDQRASSPSLVELRVTAPKGDGASLGASLKRYLDKSTP